MANASVLPLRCCGQCGATHHSGMVVAQPCSLAFVELRAFVKLVRGSATVWERSGLSAPQPHSKVPQGPSAPPLRKDRSFVGQPCCNMAFGPCSPEVTTTKWEGTAHFTSRVLHWCWQRWQELRLKCR